MSGRGIERERNSLDDQQLSVGACNPPYAVPRLNGKRPTPVRPRRWSAFCCSSPTRTDWTRMAKRVAAADQTTAPVEPATTIDPVAETPAAPPSSSSSATTTKSSDDPLDVEHYIPRLPLQLAAIAFALAAPVAAAAATGSRTSTAVPRPAEVLAAWIDSPRETLAFQSALVAVVQVWFGYWARTCRGAGRGRKTKTAREQVQRSRSAARRTAPKGFGAIMNHIWHNDVRRIGTESILRGGEGANRNFGGVDYSVRPQTSPLALPLLGN